jgi:NAD(P)-dependent dehydrogenase (short-subunit alcohol dehydrogenase family)
MNPIYDFRGQVALVTGASSGMGLATARAFAKAGAAVVLADINDKTLRTVTDELSSAGHRCGHGNAHDLPVARQRPAVCRHRGGR